MIFKFSEWVQTQRQINVETMLLQLLENKQDEFHFYSHLAFPYCDDIVAVVQMDQSPGPGHSQGKGMDGVRRSSDHHESEKGNGLGRDNIA